MQVATATDQVRLEDVIHTTDDEQAPDPEENGKAIIARDTLEKYEQENQEYCPGLIAA
jgi:hypothetical protein